MMGLAVPQGRLDVLCVGAHPDDIEIGCGGTLLRLGRRPGTVVTGLVMTATPERRKEAEAALPLFSAGAGVEVLDLPDGRLPAHWNAVKEALEDVARRPHPDLVLAPRVDDAHQDHSVLGRLVRTVWRDSLLLHYEIPKWDGDSRSPDVYVPLSADDARRKVELLDRCFPSQTGRDWWDAELFTGVLRQRGMESRTRYAEGFFAHKVLVDIDGAGGRDPEA